MDKVLSKNEIKRIQQLHLKKFRDQECLYLIEGEKLVKEAISANVELTEVYGTEDSDLPIDFTLIDKITLDKISSHNNPHKCLALAKFQYDNEVIEGPVLVFDKIRDPGNLGTIMRSAHWFGFKNIVCSLDSVDKYNSKVVRASMGAMFHVNVLYKDLNALLAESSLPIYILDMHGESIYSNTEISEDAMFVFGNEANGISAFTFDGESKLISIPGKGQQESLNLAMTANLLMGELYRRKQA